MCTCTQKVSRARRTPTSDVIQSTYIFLAQSYRVTWSGLSTVRFRLLQQSADKRSCHKITLKEIRHARISQKFYFDQFNIISNFSLAFSSQRLVLSVVVMRLCMDLCARSFSSMTFRPLIWHSTVLPGTWLNRLPFPGVGLIIWHTPGSLWFKSHITTWHPVFPNAVSKSIRALAITTVHTSAWSQWMYPHHPLFFFFFF